MVRHKILSPGKGCKEASSPTAFLPPFSSQNEKELQEVIQQQNEKILEQIDKSGELIVRSS